MCLLISPMVSVPYSFSPTSHVTSRQRALAISEQALPATSRNLFLLLLGTAATATTRQHLLIQDNSSSWCYDCEQTATGPSFEKK